MVITATCACTQAHIYIYTQTTDTQWFNGHLPSAPDWSVAPQSWVMIGSKFLHSQIPSLVQPGWPLAGLCPFFIRWLTFESWGKLPYIDCMMPIAFREVAYKFVPFVCPSCCWQDYWKSYWWLLMKFENSHDILDREQLIRYWHWPSRNVRLVYVLHWVAQAASRWALE